MFGELPKLFDRNFAIAYVLPMAFFIAATSGLVWLFNPLPRLLQSALADLVSTAAIIGLLSFFGGIILLALNRKIYRLMEGYGLLNPFQLLKWIEQQRYIHLYERLSQLDEKYRQLSKLGKELPPTLQSERDKLMQKATEQFPDHINFLLPTAFGNSLRAFEVYPRVMYGSDSIISWSRLLTVIPKEYRELVDSAKAQVDFWLNLWLLSIVFIIEYATLAFYRNEYQTLWFMPLGFILIWFIVSEIKNAVIEWGDHVKAAYDVFLPKLAAALEMPLPTSRDNERELWTNFTQATLYRLPDSLHERTQPQTKIDCEDQQEKSPTVNPSPQSKSPK